MSSIHSWTAVLSGLAFVTLSACSSNSATAPNPDSGAHDSANGDAEHKDAHAAKDAPVDDGSGVCNDVAKGSTIMPSGPVPGMPPTSPAGGTIASGTYSLVSIAAYYGFVPEAGADAGAEAGSGDASTAMAFGTIVVSGDSWQADWAFDTPPNETYQASISGTTLTLNIECPPQGPDLGAALVVSYTASDNQIVLYLAAFGAGPPNLDQPTYVATFAKM
jgi:hypothetical protein